MTTPNTTGPSAEARLVIRGTVPGTSLICESCGCRWKKHADGMLQLFDNARRPQSCCDNHPNPPLRPEEPDDAKGCGASEALRRYDLVLERGIDGRTINRLTERVYGSLVYHSDHLAALSRAREDARREALEEAKRRIQAIKGRPSAYDVECFGASSRKGGTWIERYVAVAAIDEALLTPTPQGETKEQS